MKNGSFDVVKGVNASFWGITLEQKMKGYRRYLTKERLRKPIPHDNSPVMVTEHGTHSSINQFSWEEKNNFQILFYLLCCLWLVTECPWMMVVAEVSSGWVFIFRELRTFSIKNTAIFLIENVWVLFRVMGPIRIAPNQTTYLNAVLMFWWYH